MKEVFVLARAFSIAVVSCRLPHAVGSADYHEGAISRTSIIHSTQALFSLLGQGFPGPKPYV